ncbi:MAG: hydroxyacylglutathione hydrolase [Rhodospirillales bacterium]|nr:hydroxyacylglutathione hydrolase [Rhodospirillales bacterium]
MKIELIPLLQDNYAYLLIDGSGTVAVIDPSEAAPVQDLLESRGLTLDMIINTHHHGDHTGGNAALKKAYGCKVYAPEADAYRISTLDSGLKDGDTLNLGQSSAQVFATPGHTNGHICLYFAEDKALFCGDTLFGLGCGRLFEGTPEQMWESLSKIMALPDDTDIYCGHEYTLENGTFCLDIDPDNTDLQQRMADVRSAREQNLPTIPFTLALEKKTSPFLRAGSAERFAEIRCLRDAV